MEQLSSRSRNSDSIPDPSKSPFPTFSLSFSQNRGIKGYDHNTRRNKETCRVPSDYFNRIKISEMMLLFETKQSSSPESNSKPPENKTEKPSEIMFTAKDCFTRSKFGRIQEKTVPSVRLYRECDNTMIVQHFASSSVGSVDFRAAAADCRSTGRCIY